MAAIFFGDEVDFVALLSYLQKNGRAIDDVFRRRDTFLCLLRAFIFVGGTANKGPAILLGIAEAVHRSILLPHSLSLRLSYVCTALIITWIKFSRVACYYWK